MKSNSPTLKQVFMLLCSSVVTAVIVVAALLTYLGLQYSGYSSDKSSSMLNSMGSAPEMSNGITAGFGAVDSVPNSPESESFDAVTPPTTVNNLYTDRKLIKRASIRVETTAFDEYMSWLDEHVVALGGYFESKETNSYVGGYDGSHSYRVLKASIRVPVIALGSFLDDIQSEGNVTNRSESQEDITTSYTDTDAHLESVRIEQKRLNELLERAETVEEILAIEDRLSYVRYEIESYERQLRNYDSQIEYSTVNVTLEEVLTYTTEEPTSFFARCIEALKNNLSWLGESIQSIAIFLFAHIVELVVGFIGGYLVYQWRKKRKKNSEQNSRNP